MASRWFVFWMGMFVIAMIIDWDCSIIFLVFAILTDDAAIRVVNKYVKK